MGLGIFRLTWEFLNACMMLHIKRAEVVVSEKTVYGYAAKEEILDTIPY